MTVENNKRVLLSEKINQSHQNITEDTTLEWINGIFKTGKSTYIMWLEDPYPIRIMCATAIVIHSIRNENVITSLLRLYVSHYNGTSFQKKYCE